VWTFSLSLPDARYSKPEQAEQFYATLLERVRALPGVQSAGATMGLPLSGMSYNISLKSKDGVEYTENNPPTTQLRIVTPDYFGAVGMRLIRGRTIAPTDRQGSPRVAVISEALAKLLWPGEDAIGRRFVLGTTMGTSTERVGGEVVGVVADVRAHGIAKDARPTAYFPHAQVPITSMSLAVRSSNPASLRIPLERLVASLDPELPTYEERTFDAMVGDAVAEPRLYAMLLLGFATTALALAAVGVYGVVSLAVGQRTREIGVRMALGARRADVLRMVARQAMMPLIVGVVLGLAAAWQASRGLAALLYGVSATDPLTFVAVPAFLLGVALLACYVPARRATAIPPTLALRAE
jgi:predicted permease